MTRAWLSWVPEAWWGEHRDEFEICTAQEKPAPALNHSPFLQIVAPGACLRSGRPA